MTKSFKVAEHVFSLELPDESPIWGILGQYDPFVVNTADSPLFSLTLADELPEGDMENVYDAPTEDGETVVRLFKMNDGWIFEMTPDHRIPTVAKMWSDAGFTSARLQLLSRRKSDVLFSVNNALMLLYAFRTASLGTLEMHASVVVKDGKSYLFLGKSGTGKSTQSRQWLSAFPDAHLMNDDNPIVRAWPDGSVVAYGSPWSGKTPCYRNEQAPVGAFVQIRQSPDNVITPMSLLESYAALYSSCSGFKADRMMADGLHSTLEKTVTTVPCFILDCRPDEDAARVCHNGVK